MNRAGIDISDGLGADLARLAVASSVGVRIWSSAIPLSSLAIDVGREYRINPVNIRIRDRRRLSISCYRQGRFGRRLYWPNNQCN